MLTNYLKIAFRNILRNKTFSLINISGLTFGLISFLGISLYVIDEFSYDRFHKNSDRIYRAVISAEFDGQVNQWGSVPNKLGPSAAKEIPEIEKATRVFHHNFGDIGFVSTETDQFSETRLFYADPEIFDVFTIPFIQGTADKALDRPGTIIMSETSAKRYFGDANPVGKSLLVDNSRSYEVTGIYKDFPPNSFLQCQLIASFASIGFGKPENQNWGNASFDTFFLLNKDVKPQSVDKKIAELLEREIPQDDRWFKITIQSLLDIRLHSGDLTSSIDRREYGDYKQMKILIALALVILIIAAVNYMNLTTAQAQRRNKEVGISKTLGATFFELNSKVYFEASIFVFIALAFSVVLFIAALPLFNSISGKTILPEFISQSWFWISFAGLWILLTLISGFYPAFYLSSFSPKSALLNTSHAGGQASVRKGLVILQFSISIILIICASMFYKQMSFMRDKKLGYQPDQVVAVMISAAKDRQQVTSLKTEFESLAEVKNVAHSQSYPGISTSGYTVAHEGSQQGASIATTRASHEILDVLGIELLAGKTLPENKDTKDTTVQVIINKSTADYLGYSPADAIGRRVRIFWGQPTEIIGVTEDFHFTSLHQPIGNYCFNNSKDNRFIYLLVKIQAGNLTGTINKLESTFKKIIPAAFEYSFLDQQMAKLYKAEERLSNVVLFFSGLAIFIACLGLYALASFTAEQRIKEIGIRKVMGASIFQLVAMLSKEFITLVIVAFMIGIPIGYYMMSNWLEGFAYRTNLDVIVFIISGALALFIAWVTVSFESFKAAKRNPAESLRV
jgi:putative ABC transport system permease protein